jgi:hypothetical protein
LPEPASAGDAGRCDIAGIPFLPTAFISPPAADNLAGRKDVIHRGVRGIPIGRHVSDAWVLAAIRRRPVTPFTTFELRWQYRDGENAGVPFARALVELTPFFRIINLGFSGKLSGFPAAGRYCVLRLRNPHPDKEVECVDAVQIDGEPVDLLIAGLAARIIPPAATTPPAGVLPARQKKSSLQPAR